MSNEFPEISEQWNKLSKLQKVKRYAKFLFVPCFRAQEFNQMEYIIHQSKSQRTLFRRLLTPLTIFSTD